MTLTFLSAMVRQASAHTNVTLYHPPPSYWTPPPWTLDFLRFPRDPVGGGGWTLDFLRSPTDPQGGGGWTLDFSGSPTDPLGGGGWTLDLKKERIQVLGGVVQSDVRITNGQTSTRVRVQACARALLSRQSWLIRPIYRTFFRVHTVKRTDLPTGVTRRLAPVRGGEHQRMRLTRGAGGLPPAGCGAEPREENLSYLDVFSP